jgi:hypothetical protein
MGGSGLDLTKSGRIQCKGFVCQDSVTSGIFAIYLNTIPLLALSGYHSWISFRRY